MDNRTLLKTGIAGSVVAALRRRQAQAACCAPGAAENAKKGIQGE